MTMEYNPSRALIIRTLIRSFRRRPVEIRFALLTGCVIEGIRRLTDDGFKASAQKRHYPFHGVLRKRLCKINCIIIRIRRKQLSIQPAIPFVLEAIRFKK
jgi:hypothetical protein